MRKHGIRVLLLAGVCASLLATACVPAEGGASGTFDKTLTVTGTVRLEVKNGSGDVTITPGSVGQVRVHGEVRAQQFIFGRAGRVEDILKNPPIQQVGNVIRIGEDSFRLRNVSITYRIEVPAATEARVGTGSGNIELTGLEGPVDLGTGSGDITAGNIGSRAEAGTGSGDIRLREVKGDLIAHTGSGDIEVERVSGEVRAHTGSGNIQVDRPGGRISAETGSGDVEIRGASADVRINTGSGNCTVAGNPPANSFWEVETASGDVRLDVPSDASFRLHARSRSRIETDLPLVVEEQSKRELRGRVGKGDARIEVRTSSGSIHIR